MSETEITSPEFTEADYAAACAEWDQAELKTQQDKDELAAKIANL
jgi:hypothetical protein